jgi:DNA-binding transcriptional regulator GbsR (MarR family)
MPEGSLKTLPDKQAVRIITNLLTRWGLPYRDSLIYAYLLLSPKDELSMGELSELTGLSISSVSYSLRHLMDRHFVIISRKAGRMKYYKAVPMFYTSFSRQPAEILENYVVPLLNSLLKLKEKASEPAYKSKLEEVVKDLKGLECMLTKINEIVRNRSCYK